MPFKILMWATLMTYNKQFVTILNWWHVGKLGHYSDSYYFCYYLISFINACKKIHRLLLVTLGPAVHCMHCPFLSVRGHPVVHATHVGVVLSNCQWPWHLDKSFIFLWPSSACVLRFSAIGRGCYDNWIIVQPLDDKFGRASSDYHLWCPSCFLFERLNPYALFLKPVVHESLSALLSSACRGGWLL